MPTTPYARCLAAINGGAPTHGGLAAAAGDTIQLTGENTAGWRQQRFEIYEYPSTGFACPAGWSTDPGGAYFYSAGPIPPSFTTAGGSVWGKYLFRLTTNDGLSGAGIADPSLLDEGTAISVPSPGLGLQDVAYLEAGQFSPTRKWVEPLKTMLRQIEANSGGSAVQPTRAILGTSPLRVNGGASGTLAADITLSILAASGAIPGSMSAAHHTLLAAATESATPGTLVKRDGSGDAVFVGVACNSLTFNPLAGSAVILQAPVSGVGATVGNSLIINAQSGQDVTTGTNNNGGPLVLAGGFPGAGGIGGEQGPALLSGGGTTLTLTDTGVEVDLAAPFFRFAATNAPIITIAQTAGTGTFGSNALSLVGQHGRAVASGANNNGGDIGISAGLHGTGGTGGTDGNIAISGAAIDLAAGGALTHTLGSSGSFAQTHSAALTTVTPSDATWSGQAAFPTDAKAGAGFAFTVGAAGDTDHTGGSFSVDLGALASTGGSAGFGGAFALKDAGTTWLTVRQSKLFSVQTALFISTLPAMALGVAGGESLSLAAGSASIFAGGTTLAVSSAGLTLNGGLTLSSFAPVAVTSATPVVLATITVPTDDTRLLSFELRATVGPITGVGVLGSFFGASAGLVNTAGTAAVGFANTNTFVATAIDPFTTGSVDLHAVGGTVQIRAIGPVPAAWVALTAYANRGIFVTNGGNLYCSVSGGTSAASGGPSGTGSAIVDGSVTWAYVGAGSTITASFVLGKVEIR